MHPHLDFEHARMGAGGKVAFGECAGRGDGDRARARSAGERCAQGLGEATSKGRGGEHQEQGQKELSHEGAPKGG